MLQTNGLSKYEKIQWEYNAVKSKQIIVPLFEFNTLINYEEKYVKQTFKK